MIKIDKISNIKESTQDDIFLTCASFEERCLGAIYRFNDYSTKRIILFVFDEPNPEREKNIVKMDSVFQTFNLGSNYKKINIKHGMTTDGILQLHKFCKSEKLLGYKELALTIDITTFTKELLFEVMFYCTHVLKIKKVRLLYTVPERYASPDEGPLSYGINSVKVMPFFWNGWTTTKDDLLILILGYEEMRAWSLISQFDANENILIITKPGSKLEWDNHCENYNKRLLGENFKTYNTSSMNPYDTTKLLEKLIVEEKFYEKYNIFISPLGTKPQILGVFYFIHKHPSARVNVVSTTAAAHNSPYYSSGVGETFYTIMKF